MAKGVNLGTRPMGPVVTGPKIDGGGQGTSGPTNVSGVTIDKVVPPSPIRPKLKDGYNQPSSNSTFNNAYRTGYNNVVTLGPPSAAGKSPNTFGNRAPNASGVKNYVAAERALARNLRDVAFRDFKGLAPKGYNESPSSIIPYNEDANAPKDPLGRTVPRMSLPKGSNLYNSGRSFIKGGIPQYPNPFTNTKAAIFPKFDNVAALKSAYGEMQGARAGLDQLRRVGPNSLNPQKPGNRNSNFDSGFDYGIGGGNVGFEFNPFKK